MDTVERKKVPEHYSKLHNGQLHLIQMDPNHPNATIFPFIFLTFIYSSTCFGRSPAHHQELNDCSSSLFFFSIFLRDIIL